MPKVTIDITGIDCDDGIIAQETILERLQKKTAKDKLLACFNLTTELNKNMLKQINTRDLFDEKRIYGQLKVYLDLEIPVELKELSNKDLFDQDGKIKFTFLSLHLGVQKIHKEVKATKTGDYDINEDIKTIVNITKSTLDEAKNLTQQTPKFTLAPSSPIYTSANASKKVVEEVQTFTTTTSAPTLTT